MSKHEPPLSLFVLAGMGAGALVGALIGLAIGSRQPLHPEVAESVDELKARAQQVLEELSAGLTALPARDASPDDHAQKTDDRLINH